MTEHPDIARLAAARPRESERTGEVLPPDERAAMLARIVASPRAPVDDLLGEQRRPHATRTAVLAGAGTVAVAAGFAGVALAVSGGGSSPAHAPALRLATPRHPAGATVKARLLAAFDDASDDVVEVRTSWADGSYLDEWSNGAGTIDRLVQSGWPETLTTVTSSGTTLEAVYPATQTWTTVSDPDTDPLGADIGVDELRARVESGTLSVLATGVSLDGQDTTELLLTDPPGPASDDSDLWVSSSTDLPVQEASLETTDGETEWTYYAESPAALAELTMPIPAGYTYVAPPAGSSHPTYVTYPQTLPAPASTTAPTTTVPASAGTATSAPPGSAPGTAPSTSSGAGGS